MKASEDIVPGSQAVGADKARKSLLAALQGEVLNPPPIWLMRQAGRYLPEYRKTRAKAKNFLDFCFRPDLAVEATLQPIRRYGFDAAILFSDIMVVPHALGQKVWFEEGRGPRLEPVSDLAGLERLSFAGFDEALSPCYETLRRLSRELPKPTALIGFAGAPWTVASYMVEGGGSRDYVAAKGWAYGDPAGFQRLIDLLVEATVRYFEAQIAAGAEALQLFDSWAGALPEAELRRWCLAPAREIVARIKAKHPTVPIILFPRGAGLLYRDYARQSGADALAIDTTVPLAWARDELQPHMTLQGNLDPIHLVSGGPGLQAAVEAILRELGQGPLIFNLGSGIIPQAQPELVAQLVAQVRGQGESAS